MRRHRLGQMAGLPRQEGRRFVVTGASSGLGLATAQLLGEGGAHVILAVRDEERGRQAARSIHGSTEVAHVDVSDLGSVRAFADSLTGCDVLINNAGVMATPYTRTADGFELQIASNYLGHFALTLLLLAQRKITDRIVVLASQAHRNARLDVGDLHYDLRPYDAYEAYANSKLAGLLFTGELQRRLTAAGSDVIVTAAHPGYTSTKLTESTKNPVFNAVAHVGNRTVGMAPREGALSTIAAAVLDIPGDSYVGPAGPGQLWGRPSLVGRSRAASDVALARALWEASEEATGVSLG
jgi:NAD(P)-dependent dehydrogenase (short-subunit alcohol dehydrogenase family)